MTHYYHMHTSRGMCVWGFGGTDVYKRFFVFAGKKVLRVAVLPPSPLPPPPLFLRAPRLVCEKNS